MQKLQGIKLHNAGSMASDSSVNTKQTEQGSRQCLEDRLDVGKSELLVSENAHMYLRSDHV